MNKMDIPSDVRSVVSALADFERRLESLIDEISEKRYFSPPERERLREIITPLKADIKAAAKRMKVNDDRLPQTDIERCYFEPALRSASANFTVATNSNPITSNWVGCLYGVKIDISHPLFNLKEQYPGID